ncbi:hypothetical protein DMN91_000117 [Ooceraea biroi]|uniref:Uncharacterized protein n=1 Tax=Ooceraea biroi TaxID=2015173 RepID=A0A3L8E1J1_OOCBI|nr:hypothetical protein DMN91_000117 [Ooceraea biroi]
MQLKSAEVSADVADTVDASSNLPRSQETRKSKTKKVKNYLRKCKGALSERLLEEDRRADLSRSRTSLYEDARTTSPEPQPSPEKKTPTKESKFHDEETEERDGLA